MINTRYHSLENSYFKDMENQATNRDINQNIFSNNNKTTFNATARADYATFSNKAISKSKQKNTPDDIVDIEKFVNKLQEILFTNKNFKKEDILKVFTKEQASAMMDAISSNQGNKDSKMSAISNILNFVKNNNLSKNDFVELVKSTFNDTPSSLGSIQDRLEVAKQTASDIADSNVVDIFKLLKVKNNEAIEKKDYEKIADDIKSFLDDSINDGLEDSNILKFLAKSPDLFDEFTRFSKKISDNDYHTLVTTLSNLNKDEQVADVMDLVINKKFDIDTISNLINSLKDRYDNEKDLSKFIHNIASNTKITNSKKIAQDLQNFTNELFEAKDASKEDIQKGNVKNIELSKNIRDLSDKHFMSLLNTSIKLFGYNLGTNNIGVASEALSKMAVIFNHLNSDKAKDNYSKILDNINGANLDKLNNFIINNIQEDGNSSINEMLQIGAKAENQVDKLITIIENAQKEEKELKEQGKLNIKDMSKFTNILQQDSLSSMGKGLKELFNALSASEENVLRAALADLTSSEIVSTKTSSFSMVVGFKNNEIQLDKNFKNINKNSKFFDYMLSSKDFADFIKTEGSFDKRIYQSISDRVISKIDLFSKIKNDKTIDKNSALIEAVKGGFADVNSHDIGRLQAMFRYKLDV